MSGSSMNPSRPAHAVPWERSRARDVGARYPVEHVSPEDRAA